MNEIKFTWDENKDQINRKKHGISFGKVSDMREEYDIENLNPRKNPYVKRLKKQITINIDSSTIDYFKGKAEDSGIPYQTLINLYLTDCAENNRELQITWK